MNAITNILDLSNGYYFVDGFAFKALTDPANVYDAIVIRNPGNADCWTPKIGKSNRSLREHMEYINRNGITRGFFADAQNDRLCWEGKTDCRTSVRTGSQ